jgi:predicted Zn-ribbon and HTH transcriptional regulator
LTDVKKAGRTSKTGYVHAEFCVATMWIFNYHSYTFVLSFQIDDPVKVYERKELFGFMHSWKILRHEPKWNDRILELNNLVEAPGKCNPLQGETSNDPDFPVRSEGCDKAKKSRTIGTLEGSSSSTVVEVLQQMTTNRENHVIKQDEQMAEILSRKDEKIKIHKEMLETQKKELEVRQKESEAQLLTAEAGIMSIDLEKVAPHIRDYYIGMQKQIMERHGFGPSSDK